MCVLYACVCVRVCLFARFCAAHSEFYFIVHFCTAFKLSFVQCRGKLVGKLRFALAALFLLLFFTAVVIAIVVVAGFIYSNSRQLINCYLSRTGCAQTVRMRYFWLQLTKFVAC